MIINPDKIERYLLVTVLEKTAVPGLRGLVSSGMRKILGDEMKEDGVSMREVLK